MLTNLPPVASTEQKLYNCAEKICTCKYNHAKTFKREPASSIENINIIPN